MPLKEGPREIFLPAQLEALLALSQVGLAQDFLNQFAGIQILADTIFRDSVNIVVKDLAKMKLSQALGTLLTYKEWLALKVSEYNRRSCGGKLSQTDESRLVEECMDKSLFSEALQQFTVNYRDALRNAAADSDFPIIKKMTDANTQKMRRMVLGGA